MPHLHLPAEHSDDDLVLAANLAEVVGSRDLYVAWTHGGGAAVPEVQAELRQRTPTLLARLLDGFAQLWRLLLTGSQTPAPAAATVVAAPRTSKPPA